MSLYDPRLNNCKAFIIPDFQVLSFALLILALGSSPRGSQALLKTSRAAAALRGRDFVTPDEIKAVAPIAISHRLILKPEHQIKGLETQEVVTDILRQVPVPTV